MLSDESHIDLPPVPADQQGAPVAAWAAPLEIDTYDPLPADPYPQFLDSRVYQGSSGRVFPLPFHERIADEKHPKEWLAVHLENRWLRVVVLPELGGRILLAYDRVNDYDIFYRNNVIKPALVGLTGPWISGGVEFNWPQHHRPATYLPTDWTIEHDADGGVTVWCSDHDPFARMKGMHGIHLSPDSSALEVRVRLFNRTETRQTFLWWANVAAAVGDDYQSFFPPDVHHVADHARRAVASFPAVDGTYYGVDYPSQVDPAHPDADRLDWYRNIPVPTSYMVTRTAQGFFGGYDHGRGTGFVHWADRDVSPGKKQWTWGDAPFGHAWDANLTDTDGPYVELMAGVYTDNQPDFAYLEAGETKTFSQFWFPIAGIGAATAATRFAALRLDLGGADARGRRSVRLGVSSSMVAHGAVVELVSDRHVLATYRTDLEPGVPVVVEWPSVAGADDPSTRVRVTSAGVRLVEQSLSPGASADGAADAERADDGDAAAPIPAVEPPLPTDVATIEELHLIASYLEQYRHATRDAEPYWREALARDPGDLRANVGLGARLYRSARYAEACDLFERAVARSTTWVPTPPRGEAHYRWGLALLRLDRPHEARSALAKAAWDAAFFSAAHLALARSWARDDTARGLDHARQVVDREPGHLQARNLLAVLLRRRGAAAEAGALVSGTLSLDPLDAWARDLAGEARPSDDSTTVLDVALEYASLGALDDAERLFDLAAFLAEARPVGQVNVGPLAVYHRAASALRRRDDAAFRTEIARLSAIDAGGALPLRLDDVDALAAVTQHAPDQWLAWSMLGSWFYARARPADAIAAWRCALASDPRPDSAGCALLHRNLGVAAYNVEHDVEAASRHYAAARSAAPDDARLLYEADQLEGRRDSPPTRRLALLESRRDLVGTRDDLTLELARLLTVTGRPEEAIAALTNRRFQPWEGGEGIVIAAWDAACLARGRRLLEAGDPRAAADLLDHAFAPPTSFGEGRHPLASAADFHVLRGDALAAAGEPRAAADSWAHAAADGGDFTGMATAAFTERSAWAIVGLTRLGRVGEAREALDSFRAYIEVERTRPAAIDFFATSLPTMLLFHEDAEHDRDARVTRLDAVAVEITAVVEAARDEEPADESVTAP